MNIRKKALDVATNVLKTGIQVLGGSRSTQILAQIAVELTPVISQKTEFGTIHFYCPGKLPE